MRATYGALRAGRCYLGVDAIAPATGFRFWAERGERVAQMGERAPAGGWRLGALAPRVARLRLLRDGEELTTLRGASLSALADAPGAYRVEAWLGDRGAERLWIVSNPIYLR